MPLSISEFVRRWKIYAQSEKAGAQSHFIDLCEMLGEPRPAASDSVGENYAFEKHVQKTRGGKGFADVWLRDHFAWEYKGKLKDLKKAYEQLNDYREDLGNPPLLVVCDFERFEVHTNFTATSPRVYAFSLDDLNRNQVTATCPLTPLDVLRALFGDYNVLRPERTDAQVTLEAAKLFSRLAERLELEERNLGATREEIAHFLMRLLFCLFADSIGLLPNHVFRNLLHSDDRFIPRKFLRKLALLFQAMSEKDGIFGEHSIRYFNGGLFDTASIIQLDTGDLGILYEVSKNYDWSHIAPAIFGTLFERSLDPARRSLIGAHYTSEEDILLLIEPVLMRPLEQRWAAAGQRILEALATERAEEDARSSRQARLRTDRQSEKLLAAWFDELTSVRVLDPPAAPATSPTSPSAACWTSGLKPHASPPSKASPSSSPKWSRPPSSTALKPSSTPTNSPPSSSGSASSSGNTPTASLRTASPSCKNSPTSSTATPSSATTPTENHTSRIGPKPTSSSATHRFQAESSCGANSEIGT